MDHVFLHDYGVIVFQLEYDIQVTTKTAGQFKDVRAIGWVPYSFSRQIADQNLIKVEDELMKGRGKTLDHKQLIDVGNYEIQLRATFSIMGQQIIYHKQQPSIQSQILSDTKPMSQKMMDDNRSQSHWEMQQQASHQP